MIAYKKQPKLTDFLRDNINLTAKDYNSFFIGKKKDHHRKIKSMFHNGVFKPYVKQVDIKLANVICPSIRNN